MISLTPILYQFKILKKYIYNQDGLTPTSGCQVLDENVDFIKKRIKDYKANRGQLSSLAPITYTNSALKNKLFTMYDSNSENIKELKKKLRQINKTVCAYCGTQDSPYQIDHYLPRSKFQEFSILTYNLIPSCYSCNSLYKGDEYISEEGCRLFYNPYFDTFINDIQFLKCDLAVENNYLTTEFIINNIVGTHLNKCIIIKSHFEKLHLNDRYKNLIIDDIFDEFIYEFVQYNEATKQEEFMDVSTADLIEAVDKRIRGLLKYNRNYWRKVFWEAFKNCDECLKLITEKKIILK